MNRYPAVSVFLFLAACDGDRAPLRTPVPAAARVSPPYTPPADGRLTERQISDFLAASRRRPAAPAPEASPALSGTNPDERLWVRLKILEARIALEDNEASRRNTDTYRKTIASLKNVVSVSKDPPTREALTRQIAELERDLADAERGLRRPPPPGDQFNQALVARHRREIDSASSSLLESSR